jgi:hypothetical protein
MSDQRLEAIRQARDLGWQTWEIAKVTGFTVEEVERLLTDLDGPREDRPTLSAPSALTAQPEAPPEVSSSRSFPSYQESGPDLQSSRSFPSYSGEWPTLDQAALYGISGQVVRDLAPHTEADPVALLLTFLAAAGNVIEARAHAVADAADHPARLFVVLVGQTSRARKGSAWAQVRRVLDQAEASWTGDCILGGLASGEALIDELRDASDDDPGALDRRRLIVEPEFARLLAVAGREGSILSAVLRDAWDGGVLRNRTKRGQAKATGSHVSVVGHVTREELLRRLDSTEAANGFANRFLFALVRRSQKLPEGGSLDPALLGYLADQVKAALDRARQVRVLHRSPEARELWASAYESFGDGEGGLAGAVTARPEAQALRLSVAYAALDGSEVIEVDHLEAALAVWRYCEHSALLIFGDETGDPIADRLLAAIREAGKEGLDGTAQRDLFARNVNGERLKLAREELTARGLIETTTERTGGRPRLVSRARDPHDRNDLDDQR